MNTVNRIVATLLLGAVPAVYAQTPPAGPATGDPSSASSPHQREATGHSSSEAGTAASPEPDAASSPHQRETTMGKGSSGKMKMAADSDGADPATFVKKAGLGGMTEVEVAKLVSSKTQNPEIRAFAQKMVKDHSAANQELAALAKSKGLPVPASLDAEHKAVIQKLSAKSGTDFDAAYSQQMKADHEKTIALFEGATKSSDLDLAAFAKKTLPTLKEHQHLADALPGASHSASADTPQRQ
jgi:putative membrane protein